MISICLSPHTYFVYYIFVLRILDIPINTLYKGSVPLVSKLPFLWAGITDLRHHPCMVIVLRGGIHCVVLTRSSAS